MAAYASISDASSMALGTIAFWYGERRPGREEKGEERRRWRDKGRRREGEKESRREGEKETDKKEEQEQEQEQARVT